MGKLGNTQKPGEKSKQVTHIGRFENFLDLEGTIWKNCGNLEERQFWVAITKIGPHLVQENYLETDLKKLEGTFKKFEKPPPEKQEISMKIDKCQVLTKKTV